VKRVAVMDDDEAFRDLVCEILADEGYDVVACNDPARALDQMRADRPDLIVLDFRLGGAVSGLDILAALRADPMLTATPVLVCTAALDLLERFASDLATLNAGVLPKPFDIDDFLARIAALIGPAGFDTGTSSGGAA
jgi:DNA-binding response OmpR family regulator